MYKDKEQQKQANKAASQRKRDKAKGMTNSGYDVPGMTCSDKVDDVGLRGQTAAAFVDLPKSRFAEHVTITKPIRTRTTGCKVAIPGDEDYVGVCQKIDGVWRVIKLHESQKMIRLNSLTRFQLEQAIRAYPNDQWINSPEHKELMLRLHSHSVEELEQQGYHVPGWKVAV